MCVSWVFLGFVGFFLMQGRGKWSYTRTGTRKGVCHREPEINRPECLEIKLEKWQEIIELDLFSRKPKDGVCIDEMICQVVFFLLLLLVSNPGPVVCK